MQTVEICDIEHKVKTALAIARSAYTAYADCFDEENPHKAAVYFYGVRESFGYSFSAVIDYLTNAEKLLAAYTEQRKIK